MLVVPPPSAVALAAAFARGSASSCVVIAESQPTPALHVKVRELQAVIANLKDNHRIAIAELKDKRSDQEKQTPGRSQVCHGKGKY